VEVGKELEVDEIAEVVAGEGRVVVELAVFALGGSPGFPPVGLVEEIGVFLAVRAASSARSCSRPSRYLRKRSQEVCSV